MGLRLEEQQGLLATAAPQGRERDAADGEEKPEGQRVGQREGGKREAVQTKRLYSRSAKNEKCVVCEGDGTPVVGSDADDRGGLGGASLDAVGASLDAVGAGLDQSTTKQSVSINSSSLAMGWRGGMEERMQSSAIVVDLCRAEEPPL
jgi:hypothetical protein